MSGTFLGMPSLPVFGIGNLHEHEPFPKAAHRELGNAQLRANLGHATRTIRDKRLAVVSELPDWEELRDAGRAIKESVMARLPELLEQFEANFTARGGIIHWARDAGEANRIVTALIRDQGADEVVKVKSMATQEIGLNEYLEEQGIAAFETDLAELIVQLDHDKPSHILVPAIHQNRSQVRDIFLREMEGVDPELTDEPRPPRRGRPGPPAPQVPQRQGGRVRRELRPRRLRHPRRRRIRRQRAHVPDAAGNPHHRDGHREAAADLGGPRGVPAAAARGPPPASG